MKELVIPPPATRDLNSIEMIRTWIAEQGLHCTINVGLYRDNGEHDEATAWGIILADVVRHLANAVEERYGDNQIGRASCRERVCQYVYISVVPDTLKKKDKAQNE